MSAQRTFFSFFNLLITLILLAVLFIMVNYTSSRRYSRWDLTEQQLHVLSEKTLNVLKSIKEPVTITVFYQPGHELFTFVRDLLKEYEQASDQLKIEYIDLEQDLARARQVAENLEVDSMNQVIFQAGSRNKHLSDTELAQYEYENDLPRISGFRGEEAFTSTLLNITQGTQSRVWITDGHGEKSIANTEPEGISGLKKTLERENMIVEQIALNEQAEIPKDVHLILIPGPERRLPNEELVLLADYLEKGGRLLVMIDPLKDTGLEGLLRTWGIQAGNDIVVDPASQLPFVSAANLFITTYTQHPIVEKMATLMTLYPLARSLSETENTPENLYVQPLAYTSAQGWGETTTEQEKFVYDEETDLAGPVSVAIASERTEPIKTRLVAIGDSDLLLNSQFTNVGNKDLILGAVYWLIEEEQLIGIGPKILRTVKLSLTADQLGKFQLFTLFGLPLCFSLLGAGVWWIRRD